MGCGECGALIVSPRLTRAAVTKAFQGSYFEGAPPSSWADRRRKVFEQVAVILRRSDAARVLDVGTAYGHCLAHLRDLGISGVGCDVSEQAVKWGVETLGLRLFPGNIDELPASERDFDAVLSVDALYYSDDPLSDLRAMVSRARPGGVIVCRLRNGRGAWKRAARVGSTSVGPAPFPAEHRWSFPPGAAEALFRRAGLEAVRCIPGVHSEMPLSPFLDFFARANEMARDVLRDMPIFTQSYLVIGRLPRP